MAEIRTGSGTVTQITVMEVEPGREADLLTMLQERARFMRTQPGFVSISLHRSGDGRRIVNYVQWQSREQLVAAHHAPEFRDKWPRVGAASDEIDVDLYDVVHVEE